MTDLANISTTSTTTRANQYQSLITSLIEKNIDLTSCKNNPTTRVKQYYSPIKFMMKKITKRRDNKCSWKEYEHFATVEKIIVIHGIDE
mmetsp:Transcript_13440/g.26825  ORF Transcript_13440/g.26825 Transcript_13440/m.26825 type:complete len:89 (-) Transcript_13440:521-787(-)